MYLVYFNENIKEFSLNFLKGISCFSDYFD